MKPTHTAFAFFSFVALLSLPLFAADTSSSPTTQPDPAADRLTFLTLQLSSTEASLTAVNTALRNAGYKSVTSANTAEFYAHNNADLDRNGGGPVPWDKFYGKTAKEFAPRDAFGVPHNYQRPEQFDYMYRANNDLIAKANADVSNLSKKIDDLLTRRRQLDSEQSALWAKISWESIQNHDIPLNPLYRFQLRATASTPATDARRDVLRPAILFLRTIDKTVADDLDSLKVNQDQTLTDLADRTQSAYNAAKEPFANAMLSADLSPEDMKTAKQLLDTLKRFPELAKNITESYHLALDGDTAHDDNRKLTFRAQLQSALLDYAAAAADLDYQLASLSKSWGLEPQKGVANPDNIPASTTKISPASPVTFIQPNQPGFSTASPASVISVPASALTPSAPSTPSTPSVASAPNAQQTPITAANDLFFPNELSSAHVDAQGVITTNQVVELHLRNTVGRNFVVSGEMYLDSDQNKVFGGVALWAREKNLTHRYDLTGKYVGAKRVLLNGQMLAGISEPIPFKLPDHQWIPFRFDISDTAITAKLGNQSATLNGPLTTAGENAFYLCPGAKLRGLSLVVAEPAK